MAGLLFKGSRITLYMSSLTSILGRCAVYSLYTSPSNTTCHYKTMTNYRSWSFLTLKLHLWICVNLQSTPCHSNLFLTTQAATKGTVSLLLLLRQCTQQVASSSSTLILVIQATHPWTLATSGQCLLTWTTMQKYILYTFVMRRPHALCGIICPLSGCRQMWRNLEYIC